MSNLLPAAKLIFSAHKAWAGGGLAFLAPLFVPLGAPPDDTMAIAVLLSAVITPWTHAAVDPVLFEQAMKALWVALGFGGGAGGAVYALPNKLKQVIPMMQKALSVVAEAQARREIAINFDQPATVTSTEKPVPSTQTAIPPVMSIAGMFCLSVLMLGVLAGCAAPTTRAATDLADDMKSAEEDQGVAQRLADNLLGEAKGPDHRGLRLCMIFAGVTELMADRTTHADPDYAPEALGHMTVLSSIQAKLDATAANVWFETDVKLPTLELTDILVEVGKDRVPRLLSNLAGGVNVLGVVDRARVAARQAELAAAVIRDVKRLMQQVATSALSAEDARNACAARMAKNRDRVAAIAGAS